MAVGEQVVFGARAADPHLPAAGQTVAPEGAGGLVGCRGAAPAVGRCDQLRVGGLPGGQGGETRRRQGDGPFAPLAAGGDRGHRQRRRLGEEALGLQQLGQAGPRLAVAGAHLVAPAGRPAGLLEEPIQIGGAVAGAIQGDGALGAVARVGHGEPLQARAPEMEVGGQGLGVPAHLVAGVGGGQVGGQVAEQALLLGHGLTQAGCEANPAVLLEPPGQPLQAEGAEPPRHPAAAPAVRGAVVGVRPQLPGGLRRPSGHQGMRRPVQGPQQAG